MVIKKGLGRGLDALLPDTGAEENGVVLLADFHGVFGEAGAHGVVGRAAHEAVGVLEAVAELGADLVEDLDGFGNDFRADAVAGDDCNAVGGHGISL